MDKKTNMNNRDKVLIISELGINCSGDINIAKKLIDASVDAGANCIKLQKREIYDVYTPEELSKERESPFGTTNLDQKLGIEFSEEEFDIIDKYCKEKGIKWFASAWDPKSQVFLRKYNCPYNKIASAMLTQDVMLHMVAEEKKLTFLSTGMSEMFEIEHAVEVFESHNCPYILLHCNSSYPMENSDANLNTIKTLRDKFKCEIGWSCHARGLQLCLAAVAIGATVIEKHLTLDRSSYGSDQSASIEPHALTQLCRDIHIIKSAMGDGVKSITKKEAEIRKKLANPYWVTLAESNKIKDN